jgi:hypothetical protein
MRYPGSRDRPVEVLGDEIIVTMPGTSFRVVYEKLNAVQLIAKAFTARNSEHSLILEL